jgi:hypothetical protein
VMPGHVVKGLAETLKQVFDAVPTRPATPAGAGSGDHLFNRLGAGSDADQHGSLGHGTADTHEHADPQPAGGSAQFS